MKDENTPQVPSTRYLGKVVLYIGAIVVLGMSISGSLSLLNEAFELGAAWTLVNLLLVLLLGRQGVIDFLAQDSQSPTNSKESTQ